MAEMEKCVESLGIGSNEILNKSKRDTGSIMGFGVNGCPIWVFKGIAEPAKERYNDTYWIRLAELLIIENSYYNLMDALRLKGDIDMSAFQKEAQVQTPIVEQKKEEPKYMGSGRN